jgi:hypothetical protein
VHTDNILDVLSIEFHRCVEKTRWVVQIPMILNSFLCCLCIWCLPTPAWQYLLCMVFMILHIHIVVT